MFSDAAAVINVTVDLNHIFHPFSDPHPSDEAPSLWNRVAAAALLIFSLLSLGIVTCFYFYQGHRKVLLIDQAGIQKNDENGSTYLHSCANAHTVARMIDKGADLEAKHKVTESTPLLQSYDKKVSRTLIEKGANVNAADFMGDTKLHLLAKDLPIDVKTIQLLIQKGANVNAQNKKGETPLHVVNSVIGAKILLDSGAETEIKDEEGHTPLLRTHFQNGIKKKLIDRGADVFATNNDGKTMLHLNAIYSDEMIRYLVNERHMDIEARDNNGNTPLLVTRGIRKAQLLIELGADIKAVNHKQETLLHMNLKMKRMLLEMFLKKGGNINAQDEATLTLILPFFR